MPTLVFHEKKVKDVDAFLKLCPFNAIEYKDGKFDTNAACKMCRICVKKGPDGAVEYVEEAREERDLSEWEGICVYAEQTRGGVHPVTLELIGKARELASVVGQKVYCILIGYKMQEAAEELLHWGVDEVHVYDTTRVEHFIIEPYTAIFADFINRVKPNAILVGATPVGRQLAPRIAARFRTGLTADCTVLEMNERGELAQIRPAFGGNIMAHINTPRTRPQMATVRYKVMDPPKRSNSKKGKIVHCDTGHIDMTSGIEVLAVEDKPVVKTIESAEVLVVAGRGVKKKEDLELLSALAEKLGGELACTRPLVECGWFDAKQQIGLSGRTVRPKLILTFGVSGAVQFTAGMNASDVIIAVNTDESAPIFKVAHYGYVGDMYEMIPVLLESIGK